MLYQRIKAIAKQLCSSDLSFEYWAKLAIDTWSKEDKNTLLEIVSAQSHLSIESLNEALLNSFDNFSNVIHEAINLKIQLFQAGKYCKDIQKTPLVLSRNEWVELACRFKEENRKTVTSGFFLHALSEIRDTSLSNLIETMSVKRALPERMAKRTRELEEDNPSLVTKKSKNRYYNKDEGPNPLILEATADNLDLQNKVKALEVRCTTLNPASPEKGFDNAMYTPGKTKVKPVCDINGNRFFQPFSPMKFKEKKVTQEEIVKALPKAAYKQAQPMEYTVTLETIRQCRGKTRGRSGKQIMGHSASEFMEAHGQPIDGKSHLAHLQAHCFNGPLTQDNLVPSSAAANYNTLEAIELYTMDLIETDKTDSVHISVTPNYTGDVLLANLLTFTLNWTEKGSSLKNHNEIFYITPQSTSRITQSMHQSIKLMREEVKEASDEDSSKKPGYK